MINRTPPGLIDARVAFVKSFYDDGDNLLVAMSKTIAAYERGIWQPMATAPQNREIEVYCPAREGLPPMISLCQWHPDAGFTVCEIRHPTHWREHNPPEEV